MPAGSENVRSTWLALVMASGKVVGQICGGRFWTVVVVSKLKLCGVTGPTTCLRMIRMPGQSTSVVTLRLSVMVREPLIAVTVAVFSKLAAQPRSLTLTWK